ncbi:MAG: STY4528 family pathogenicity island replication protein [Methylobacter sp.]|nr:STY4528 family pathogenicity island replication protein [Methylobacter sp.]
MPESTSNSSIAERLRDRIKADTEAQQAEQQLDANGDNLLFMGNWHDAIPRALVLDPILQSTDKCIYLLLRTYLSAQGTIRMPSYDDIGRLLGLSRGTIARCLHILRATRWITLCNNLRDETTGRFKGNVYAIHDEVLSIEETVVLDGRYIEALEDMEKNHGHHQVRKVAYAVLDTIRRKLNQDDETEQLIDLMPYHQGVTISRFLNFRPNTQNVSEIYPIDKQNDDRVQHLDAVSRVQKVNSENTAVQIFDLDSKINKIQSLSYSVQKLDPVKTDCSSFNINNINIKTTTTAERFDKKLHDHDKSTKQPIDPALIWPNELSGDARWIAWQSLRKCPHELHQDLLDEIAARMAPSSPRKINNAAGWLAWANKELQSDGIYPITNLGIKHRQLREREQQRQQVDVANKQALSQQGHTLMEKCQQEVKAKPRENEYKKNIAALRSQLRGQHQGSG